MMVSLLRESLSGVYPPLNSFESSKISRRDSTLIEPYLLLIFFPPIRSLLPCISYLVPLANSALGGVFRLT